MMFMRCRRRPALLMVAAGLPALASATNGYLADGYGIKAEGVAGAGIAFPQDSLTIATNPAGLLAVDNGVDVGVDLFVPRREASLVQGGAAQSFDGNASSLFYIPALGYRQQLSSQLAAGIALFGNGGLDTNYASNPFARFGASGSAGVDLQQAFIAPALAWQPIEGQSLGLAVNIGYQRFRAKGIGLFAGFSEDPANVSNRGADQSLGAGVHLGWIGRINEHLSIGATWQSKTWMQKFRNYAGLFADGGQFDAPSTFGVGLLLRPIPALAVVLDWQQIRYADVASVGDPVNALFKGVPLGANDGPGFGWSNVSVVKLGVNYQLNENWSVRAGVSYDNQPIPASQTFFNVLAPGVVTTHVTAGLSWRASAQDEFSLSLLYAPRKTLDGSSSIPSAFGGGEANVSLQETSIGFGWSHRFASGRR